MRTTPYEVHRLPGRATPLFLGSGIDGVDVVFLLDDATYSNYSGSSLERSNLRALLRDFPDELIEVVGDFGTTGLALRAYDGAPVVSDDLREVLDELEEVYPVYDEDVMLEIEAEEFAASWDEWVSHDLIRELSDLGVEVIDAEEIRETFGALVFASPEPYVWEQGSSTLYFPYWDEIVRQLADQLKPVGPPAIIDAVDVSIMDF